ncbi:MAG: DUF748 domain-containing protein [Puniceicoccaceae bacterium]
MAKISQLFFGSKLRILLTIIASVVGLYAIAGFFIVPWIARPKIVEVVADLTGREARLDQLRLNPFTLSGTLEGFEITDLDGESLLSFSRAHANFQLFSLVVGGHYHFKELELDDPFFRFQIEENGDFNIADILNQVTSMQNGDEESDQAPSDPKHVKVDTLVVSDGSLSITDLSRTAHFTTTISPINFDIQGFHTSGESDAPYSFTATSESGESLNWTGYVALAPVRSKGDFELSGISLPKYEPFYDIFLSTDVIDGTVGVTGSYTYFSGANAVRTLENAALNLNNINIVKAENQSPILSLESGTVSGIHLDQLSQSIEVDSVKLSNGSLHAQLLSNGSIDLMELVHPTVLEESTPVEVADSQQDKPAPFSYKVHNVTVEGFALDFQDHSLPSSATISLQDTGLNVSGLFSEEGSKATVTFSTTLSSGGNLRVNGEFGLLPIQASLDLNLDAIHLSAGNPYIASFTDVQLTDGSVSVVGKLSVALENETPTGTFEGSVDMTSLHLVESIEGQELASMTRLGIEGIRFELQPMALQIENIAIVEPRADLQIDEAGQMNLMRALRMETDKVVQEEPAVEDKPEEEVQPAPAESPIPFPISIGSVTLEKIGAVMTDNSISPPVKLGLESLSGSISGLSSEELARADLDLQGNLVGGTSLSLKGKINPLIADRYSDMEMSFKDFNLTAISPYAGKYAGYALAKGKLSFDLKYRISHSELEGENVMIIDQLTLGEKVESEDAVNLPIPLAISLMKDGAGVIEIDVPVSGNLNDPEFSFGRVISRAIVNVITKVITSPFSMLGGLVPGGEDVDLSVLAYTPGRGSLTDENLKKLELLAGALQERPSLKLDIIGLAGGAEDVSALKVINLDKQLAALKWKELADAGQTIAADEVEVSETERTRLLTAAFANAFPEEMVITAPIPDIPTPEPTPDVSVDEPEQEETLVGGLFRRIFGGEADEPSDEPVPVPPTPEVATVPEEPIPVLPDISVDEMQSRLIELIEISEDDLHQLADARAEAVRKHLETASGIPAERLFVTEPEEASHVSIESGLSQVDFKLE